MARTAKMQVQKSDVGFDLTTSVPFNVNAKEFSALHNGIIDRIKDLTGCPCMSGLVRVVLEGDFGGVVDVNLETGKPVIGQ